MARVGGEVQLAGGRVSGRQAPSGRKWQGSQSSEGATELGFPGPALGKMQSEAARRVGEPSGEGEEPPPEGLGGYDLLTQPEPRGPAGQVMRQHLHRQPGAVGGEATRGEMVQPHAVLQVSAARSPWGDGRPGREKNRAWVLGGSGQPMALRPPMPWPDHAYGARRTAPPASEVAWSNPPLLGVLQPRAAHRQDEPVPGTGWGAPRDCGLRALKPNSQK